MPTHNFCGVTGNTFTVKVKDPGSNPGGSSSWKGVYYCVRKPSFCGHNKPTLNIGHQN